MDLIKKLEDNCYPLYNQEGEYLGKGLLLEDIQNIINDTKGENITDLDKNREFECSECGHVYEIKENFYELYDTVVKLDRQKGFNPNFCPHCGAKIIKEEK